MLLRGLRQIIEEALRGEWQFTVVEMVKRNGDWYAHFVLKKIVEIADDFETIIGIDMGERNLAVAVAISKNNPNKPMKGQFTEVVLSILLVVAWLMTV